MPLPHALPHTAIVFALFCYGPRFGLCGNEVFSSLAQLENLRNKDTLLVNTIDNIIKNLRVPPRALTR